MRCPDGHEGARNRRPARADRASSVEARAIHARELQRHETAVGRLGFPFSIRKLQTDNGSEFSLAFSLSVQETGIRHRYIKPRRPQQNGKVERSHRVDNEEFWNRRQFVSHEEAAIALSDWQDAYNHQRFSMALGGQTPVERLAAKLTDPAGPTSEAA
jgi:transposase InsO family protein